MNDYDISSLLPKKHLLLQLLHDDLMTAAEKNCHSSIALLFICIMDSDSESKWFCGM
jgi:hypothetical protein